VRLVVGVSTGWLIATVALADEFAPGYSAFGTPGLIDMPTAGMAADAELAVSYFTMKGTDRGTLTFQISPRLTGSFRYSKIAPYTTISENKLFDRSFDLRFRFVDEGRYRPAVAVGLQDFIGTGFYSAEYIVADKHLGPRLTVTGGIGWGRLGSHNGFANPIRAFRDRPTETTGHGGQFESGRWFRGDAAIFGGIAWKATERLTVRAEYSSDAYVREVEEGHFTRSSPLNFGIDYRVDEGISAQASWLHGDTLGVGLTFALNPKTVGVDGGRHPGPPPVLPRAPGAAADLGWSLSEEGRGNIRDTLAAALYDEDLVLEAMTLEVDSIEVLIRNERFGAPAEAVGRTARILTRTLPASVETIVITPVATGIPVSSVTLRRSDIEELEHHPDGTLLSYVRARIRDAAEAGRDIPRSDGLYPRFAWQIRPYMATFLFDPDNPFLADVGLRFTASHDVRPGLYLWGIVEKKAFGNRGKVRRESDSTLPHVRSDSAIYAREGDPAVRSLTLAHYFRPGRDLYGRVTAGYLEQMYGGVSGELLWKPVNSRIAMGAEMNWVRQRDFDQLFGFRDYRIATGHVSGYWEMAAGLFGQIDVGRYLAGDWGATLRVDREFRNGWQVGAYATFTDVSFEDFGEGSFDKGILITIPLESIAGRPVKRARKTGIVIRPLYRDGGARLHVDGRLYETVRSYHDPGLRESWGRFWR